jgi:hypothetical protein
MPYIGNVSPFESVGTSELKDGSVTVAKLNAAVANSINPSLGTASIIRTNANTISENITIPANTNGMSAGPITIADGNTIILNGTWSIV